MIPRVLVDPPWRRSSQNGTERRAPAPARVASAARLVWAEGERDSYRGKPPPRMTEAAEERLFEKLLDECDKQAPLRAAEVLRLGDEKLGELAEELDGSTADGPVLKLLLGRLGDAIAVHAVSIVRGAPPERGLLEAALPLRSAELAPLAAKALAERAIPASLDDPYVESPAEAWLERHHDAAIEGLAHLAHEPGPARTALAFAATRGHLPPEELATELAPFVALAGLARGEAKLRWALLLAAREDPRAVALVEGEPCAAAFVAREKGARDEELLEAVPGAVAELPPFFDPAKLARPALKSGEPLGDDAVRALAEMLRFSPLGNPYLGLTQVVDACDRESLDAFAHDLFEAWREAGEDPKEGWCLEACGKIGGDRCARTLGERIRSWARGAEPPRYGWDDEVRRMVLVSPGSRGFSFARTGCDVLAAMHGELAHTVLDELVKGGVQVWLRREAGRASGSEAAERHDDVEAPVPSVGLDVDGSATLAWGDRTYRVTVDDALVPVLVDASGEKVASFPRAKKGDDAKAHAAAKERFAGIVKDAKIVARYQIALLERMMCSGRTFRASAFRERFLAHPFLRHAGRRVVFFSGGTAFRIAEDGSFANVRDEAWTLGDEPVGVVHPVALGASELQAWRSVFSDYRIVQPFAQLERDVYACEAAEIGEHELVRFVGAKTSRGRLFQLARRGWRSSYEDVAAGTSAFAKELDGGAWARVVVTPEVREDAPADAAYEVTRVFCTHAFDRVPKIELPETLRDVAYLRGT